MEDAFSLGPGKGTKFCNIREVVDMNRLLIKLPNNLSRDVGLIKELKENIRRVVDLYSDLSNSWIKRGGGCLDPMELEQWTALWELGMDNITRVVDLYSYLLNPAKSMDANSSEGDSSDVRSDGKAVHKRIRGGGGCWDPMELEQWTTLAELGMDPDNKGIISDLLRFVGKKNLYKTAGKPWKRGYLLYDTPGSTDRSSLIAAMANRLEFDIYHLDLTGLSSISELTNVLVSIRKRSLIAIKDLDHWAGKLPDFKTELTLSSLLKIIHGLLSSCGDERIIVLTTNHNHNHNHIDGIDFTDLPPRIKFDIYIHISSPQPIALPDGGEIVQFHSSEQKPSVDCDAINNRAYQSDDLVSNSEEKNMREASRRQCMPEGVLSLVDSTTRISSTDFDAPDNNAHCVRAYQSGPIVFNSEKVDAGEGLNRESLTKSALSLDDSTKPMSLPDSDATENKVVKVYTRRGRGCWHSLEELEQRMTLEELGMDPENEGIISDLLRFVSDKEEFYKKADKDWKRGYLLYDSPSTDRSSLIAAMANRLEFDIFDLDLTGLTSISELTNVLVSIRNRSLIAIKDFDHWVGMLPNLENELTLSSLLKIIHGLLSSCGDERIIVLTTNHNHDHIGSVDAALLCSLNIDLYIHWSSPQPKALPDGGEIVLFDSSAQKPSVYFYRTNNRAYQSDVLVPNSEDKNTPEASRRQCMPKRVLSLVDSTARISLVDFDASDNRARLVRVYQSGPVVFNSEKKDTGEGLSRECLTKSVLSLDDSKDVAVTEKKSHLVRAYQSGPVVSLSDDINRGEPLKRECINKSIFGIEDLQQHSGGRRDDAAKIFCEQQAFDATNNRAHLVKADESGPTVSNSEKGCTREALKRDCLTNELSLEDLQQHFGARSKDAAKGLCDSPACKSFEVLDSLPLGERSNIIRHLARRRTLTHKHCVRLKKSQDLLRSLQRDCSGGLAPQSAIGLPDGGHILYLPEKKIVRKTLKRKCRSTSVLSLEDHKQHVDRRWEDAAKSHGTKPIRRQLVIHRLSTAKRTHKQHGIHQWPLQRSAIGLPDEGHILSLSEKKIVRKTLKRKCRSMSVLSLVDRQQHVDRRWEDAAKNIGAKRICRQLVIHRVSIAKRICRQHGIHHRWPFERDQGTMKGYTLRGERPVEVIRLSTDGKLVSRLQVIYISWLGRFSPPPSTLPGGEILGHIALSSSQFATTNSIAQRVRQDQSGSASSDSENERTREQENPEEIYTSITKDDLLQRMGRMKRGDAAASLGISVSTFKRIRSEFGIKRWPRVREKKVRRPPDQHGERNTSTACKTPLHNVNARMEGEPVGQNQEANEFRRDFMEHSIALNTENDSMIAVYSETEAARGSSKWAFQLEGQTMQSTRTTTYPYRDDLVFSQSRIASAEVVNENMGSLQDGRDLSASQVVAPQKESLLEGHVFGFGNWTVGSCSDLASNQTMRTFSHATGSSENLENWLASVEEHLMEENVYGSSRSDPAPSQPMRTIHHKMAAIPHMMPLPTERQDTGSVKLKATYGDTKIKFQFPLTSGINELKEVMSKILERELGSFKIEYKDEDGEWILMALDEHVREYLRLLTSLGNEVTELKIQDKVPNTTKFCDNCGCYNRRSLKRKRR
ncbi:uncharacterized protein LOC131325758 isoform X2 [Rhododendron vialii]|uniref:uncharacterized protein LOC131325758 isoform X2 n=1 Tax=Rhododendron vialii TaxID=182163 RepID=UPI0026600EE5|nr:uncharacterized protein LOC131325758 isoform X2 [Rhododendron vialii]